MLLFRYIFKEYFKYLIGTVFLCIFLFTLFDFIHKSTKYLGEFNPEVWDLTRYYLFQLPSRIVEVLPIASLISSVVSMVLLSRTNELTAMRAAGMGPWKIGLPLALGGLGVSLVSLLIGEFVQPEASKKMHFIQEVLIEKKAEQSAAGGVRWMRQGLEFFNFVHYQPQNQILSGIKIISFSEAFKWERILEAQSAYFDATQGLWKLMGIRVTLFDQEGSIQEVVHSGELVRPLPFDPAKLQKDRRVPNELSIRELGEIVSRARGSGLDILALEVDRHIKLAFHFASFIVSLIGIKFCFKSERTMETAKSVLMAIAVGISYWFILNAFRAIGRRSAMPPSLAAWSANIIVLGLNLVMIYRAQRTR